MSKPSVAFRLGTEGKQDVKRDFAEVRRDGETAFQGIATAAEQAGNASSTAAERQAQAWQRQANAAKVAMAASANQNAFNSVLGVSNSGVGSARASAEVFEAAARAEEQLEQRARALKAAIDPAWAAQDRFNGEMREAKTLLDAGKISTDQYMTATMRAKAALDSSSASLQRHGNMTGEQRARYVQLGYQMQDISMQLATGVNPLIVLAQQGGQTASALAGAGGVAGRVASFFAGPWGAALLAGGAAVGLLWQNLNGAKSSTDALADSQNALATFFDRTTGKIKEQNQALIQGRLITARNAEEKLRAEAGDSRAKILRVATGDIDLQRAEDALRGGGSTSAYAAALASVAERKPWLQTTIDGLLRTAEAMAKNEDGAKRLAAEQRMLRGTATEADKAMLGFTQTNDRAARILSEVIAGGSGAAAANERYTMRLAELKRQLDDNQISEAQYRTGVEAAIKTREAATSALKANTAAMREDKRELKEYLRDIEGLVQRYDQLGSAFARYKEDMVLLSRGVAGGEIGAEQAATIRKAAIDAMIKASEVPRSATIEVDPVKLSDGGDMQANRDAKMQYLDRLAERMRNLSENGKRWLDTLLDPSGWRDWGDAAMSVLADVKNELLRMAITNPLKEALFGSGGLLAGLAADVGGALLGTGRFVPSAETLAGPGFAGPINIGNNALGTDNWRGGLTWIAENGPELVNLPKGSKVVPAGETRRLLSGGGAGDSYTFHQTIAPSFLGDAATRQDLAQAMMMAKTAAVSEIAELQRRRGGWRR